MISGLWNGITGLNTFERALTTQSNNVTNSNTIGHKSDEISFQDLMYQSGYGKGVNVQSVEKNFSQGNINVTDNTLDVAIEGSGFFVVNDPTNNETYYSRAGNFKMGVEGYLESIEGHRIFGTPTTISSTVSSDDNTQFNSNYTSFIASEPISSTSFLQTINAKSTNYNQSAVDSGVSGSGFKTAGGKISDIKLLISDYNEKLDLYSANPTATSTASTSQITQIDFADFSTQLTNGSYIEIYTDGDLVRQYFDTDAQTTMNEFADKLSNVAGLTSTVDSNGLVTINTLIPGKDVKLTSAGINDRGYGLNEVTSPVLGSGIAMVNSSRDALKSALENADAKFLEITNNVTNADASLSGIGQMQLRLNDLNLTENTFGVLSIEDGIIYSKDGDNKFLMGKLETAYFSNPESLEPQGGTLYSIGKETGEAKNANNINKLIGGSVELSNTNFSDSLVDLMVYQRAFEASSKSITTSDEFLKTAIQLKK
ncbi:flagellar hook-basal body complex protein [Arcobacter sp. LA11]|uniref:flagellar hook-basal body complex protein n=1 Tax=Arcobacter sp. LA11 TaxID=1898176 RepID=UPI00093452E4|nr:flagellar hook-basal body complex protein [Arcobacter sp. LA11]